ncbi:MAG: SelB C-terminal domain-containing protein, partial [Anaerolineaceae bacterium]|nr:SelB C-terminal domain-containing protein [Anaerolineaceae bacterium]
IENMLAGVGGIDAVLFVVAADEGVMPQTREHLAILDILQIESGLIALTKLDLAADPDWLEMVTADVREAVRGTVLENAPVIPVSAKTGQGVPELIRAVEDCLAGKPPRPDLGRPRLPVDRVFTVAGFGTVVTGTLIDGQFKLGEEVEILPSGIKGRVRGLQTHKKKEQSAVPGSRTAMNISGVDVNEVRRGDVIAHPGRYRPTGLLDVHFRLLADASASLKHSSDVKFFVGSSEVQARVRLLGTEELRPGEQGWLQLELREPVVVVRGDRYILRRPSPAETLGGGSVVDPYPKRRHRRFAGEVISQLEALMRGSPGEVLAQAFLALGYASIKDAVTRSRLGTTQTQAAIADLVESAQLVVLEPGAVSATSDLLAVAAGRWAVDSQKAQGEVQSYHRAYPLRRGMSREELKSRLKMQPRQFNAAVRQWFGQGLLEERATLVALPGHKVVFSVQQQAQVDRLLAMFAAEPYATPSVKEAQAEVGEDVYQALLEMGNLVQVSSEVVFRKEDYDNLVSLVNEHFTKEPTLTVAQLRDRLNTSRKYILGFLEHLDAAGVTVRDGDFRKLRAQR